MRAQIMPSAAGGQHQPFAAFARALDDGGVSDKRVIAGFAYATRDGVRHFLSIARRTEGWAKIPKQFVLGIHHGITEPSALELLCAVDNSEVRIFIPGRKLAESALTAAPLFHPKTLAIVSQKTGELSFLQAGSANLTAAAIGTPAKNYELSISLSATAGAQLKSAGDFQCWWAKIVAQSRLVDRSLIARYATIRLTVFDRNPMLQLMAGVPTDIAEARHFFVEVGAGSGPPGTRHQVEFPESLAAFFGKPQRSRRDLTLVSGGRAWQKRPLSFKTTTFGVKIWRLGMPTQHSGGPPIADRAIRFERSSSPDCFYFEVADTHSPAFARWRRLANAQGHLGATHGQRPRAYGFY